MSDPKKFVIYTRQSKKKLETVSHEIQEESCRRYAESKGYQIVEVINEKGVSARTIEKRKEFQRATKMITDGEANGLLIWRWTRFARNSLDGLITLRIIEQDAGGLVECATEQIDRSSAMGKFQTNLMLNLAEFESDEKSDLWKNIHNKRLEDGHHPHMKPRFGYDRIDMNGNVIDESLDVKPRSYGFIINEREAEALRTAYEMVLNKKGLIQVCNYWNNEGFKTVTGGTFGRSTVAKLLEHPFASGYFEWKGEIHKGSHEPIISRETYLAFMRTRKDNAALPSGVKSMKSIYTEIGYCTYCDCRLVRNITDGKVYYRCSTKHRKGKDTCQGVSIRQDRLMLLDNYQRMSMPKQWEESLPNLNDLQSEREGLEAKLADLKEQLNNSVKAATAAGLSLELLTETLAGFRDQITETEAKLEDVLADIGASTSVSASTFDFLEPYAGLEKRWDVPELRLILSRLYSKIVVHGKDEVTFYPHGLDPVTRKIGKTTYEEWEKAQQAGQENV